MSQLSSTIFSDPLVAQLLCSIDINVPRPISPQAILSIEDLTALVQATFTHPHGVLLRPLFLLAFFGFVRISNLLPKSALHYDPHFTLLRQDVALSSQHATITLKFTKSRQSRSRLSYVQVPVLNNSILCPVRAVSQLLALEPLPSEAPLFARRLQGQIRPLTQVQARQALATLCSNLNISYKALGFHGFRRSGVSFLYSHQVSLQHLQHHGTWSSQAIYNYLANSATSTVVPSAFQHLLA